MDILFATHYMPDFHETAWEELAAIERAVGVGSVRVLAQATEAQIRAVTARTRPQMAVHWGGVMEEGGLTLPDGPLSISTLVAADYSVDCPLILILPDDPGAVEPNHGLIAWPRGRVTTSDHTQRVEVFYRAWFDALRRVRGVRGAGGYDAVSAAWEALDLSWWGVRGRRQLPTTYYQGYLRSEVRSIRRFVESSNTAAGSLPAMLDAVEDAIVSVPSDTPKAELGAVRNGAGLPEPEINNAG